MTEDNRQQSLRQNNRAHPRLSLDEHDLLFITRPFRFIMIISILVFLAEIIVMLVISLLPPLSIITEAFVDALLLALISFPILYFLFLKTLKSHVAQDRRLEEELEKLKSELSRYKK